MAYIKGTGDEYTNVFRDSTSAIDSSGINYDDYDKNSYLVDGAQWLWNELFGVGGDQAAINDNRQKAEAYAQDIFNRGGGVWNGLDTDDYKVANQIRQWYDVDEQKGLGLITGGMNWLGDKWYDDATHTNDTKDILSQLMMGGQAGTIGGEDYTLGSDIYQAILNGDQEYVDNVLRTIGADMANSGYTNFGGLTNDELIDQLKYYNQTLGKSNGYDDYVSAAKNGEDSPITLGARGDNRAGLVFTEDGKYDPLRGNADAAKFLDAADLAATVLTLPAGGGAMVGGKLISNVPKVTNMAARALNGADKVADTARAATATERLAADANKGAKAADAASDAAKASNAANKMSDSEKMLAEAENILAEAAGETAANAPKIVSNAQNVGSSYGRFNVPIVGQRARDMRSVRNAIRDAEKTGSKAARGGKTPSKIENPYSDPSKIDEMNSVLSEKGLTGLNEEQRALYDSIMRSGGIRSNARNAARFMTRPRNVSAMHAANWLVNTPSSANPNYNNRSYRNAIDMVPDGFGEY